MDDVKDNAEKIAEKADQERGRMTIKTTPEFLGYQGSTPFIELDENFEQMTLDRTKVTIPREHLMRMMPLAYLAGKLSVLNVQQKTSIFMIILLISVIAVGAFNYYLSSNLDAKLNRAIDSSNAVSNSQKVQQQDINIIKNALGISNNSIPTVGG